MKDLSKTELLIMKCVWGSDHPVTATQIQQIFVGKNIRQNLTADHSARLCTALIRRAMST